MRCWHKGSVPYGFRPCRCGLQLNEVLAQDAQVDPAKPYRCGLQLNEVLAQVARARTESITGCGLQLNEVLARGLPTLLWFHSTHFPVTVTTR